jgi:hypothetical protein
MTKTAALRALDDDLDEKPIFSKEPGAELITRAEVEALADRKVAEFEQ